MANGPPPTYTFTATIRSLYLCEMWWRMDHHPPIHSLPLSGRFIFAKCGGEWTTTHLYIHCHYQVALSLRNVVANGPPPTYTFTATIRLLYLCEMWWRMDHHPPIHSLPLSGCFIFAKCGGEWTTTHLYIHCHYQVALSLRNVMANGPPPTYTFTATIRLFYLCEMLWRMNHHPPIHSLPLSGCFIFAKYGGEWTTTHLYIHCHYQVALCLRNVVANGPPPTYTFTATIRFLYLCEMWWRMDHHPPIHSLPLSGSFIFAKCGGEWTTTHLYIHCHYQVALSLRNVVANGPPPTHTFTACIL